MNTAYNYKNNAKNVNSYNVNSKKGTVTPLAYDKTSQTDFLEKSLSFIDAIVELLSSARLLIGAKAFFAFIALLGFFGVIGMFLSPPLFSIIYMLIKDATNHRLATLEQPTDTEHYSDLFATTAQPRKRRLSHLFSISDRDHNDDQSKGD